MIRRSAVAGAVVALFPCVPVKATCGSGGLSPQSPVVMAWVVPCHEGAVRAFKEKGAWNDAAQKHNDRLIKRQQVMIDAWKAHAVNAPSDDKAFTEGWMKTRAAALSKAGMDVIFE